VSEFVGLCIVALAIMEGLDRIARAIRERP